MIKAFSISLLLVFTSSIGYSQLGGTDHTIDSLKHKLAVTKDDTSRVLIMADIGNAYGLNDSRSICSYGDSALTLAQTIRFIRGEATALNTIGLGLQIEGDYPKALEYLYRGLQIAQKRNFVYETAVCYEWIGSTYWFLADYSKAVDFYQKSEDLFETIINNPLVPAWIGFNILSLGQAYLEWNHLDSAYNHLDSAYKYLSQYYDLTLQNKIWHPNALYLLGDCLFQRGNRDTSFEYLRQGIAAAMSTGDYFTQSEGSAAISRCFKKTRQFDSSIYYAQKGLAAAKRYGYKLGVYKNSKLLAEEYEQLNVQEALHYWKVYDSVNEEMYGAKKVKDLQKTLAEEQHRQQQIQEQQTERETRLKQYGFMTGLAIMLLIAFILYRNNLQKKKANFLLQHQKEKVENTLEELRSAQGQLIQSEKMASLGELTAGIAHEIQNPLNFVNNFSEVNNELISELVDEADKGNTQEVKIIANDIKQNLEKINHHGKRADSIVKGMLQHSRSSSGQKELTDINALCDEYLRLAYHGLRAKDKSFNAKFETDFDPSIDKINIVPQDIGRVILNLINNAFYAVSEKKKAAGGDYEPTVIATTKKLNDKKVEIKVIDNGNGIPQKVVDKIFQPFFTTKPTGQGTGLGLSLAYDIIKAHGGEIKVHTKEGKGTEFLIELLTNRN